MGFISENVIPGDHGKVFGTNAKENIDLMKIHRHLLQIDGIKDVIFKSGYPVEFTVHTTKIIEIREVEKVIKELGFNAIPKGLFSL